MKAEPRFDESFQPPLNKPPLEEPFQTHLDEPFQHPHDPRSTLQPLHQHQQPPSLSTLKVSAVPTSKQSSLSTLRQQLSSVDGVDALLRLKGRLLRICGDESVCGCTCGLTSFCSDLQTSCPYNNRNNTSFCPCILRKSSSCDSPPTCQDFPPPPSISSITPSTPSPGYCPYHQHHSEPDSSLLAHFSSEEDDTMYAVSAKTRGPSKKNEGDEYMALCAPRYKPEELDKISTKTKFSRSELQVMYRGFKQECPTGIVNKDKFKSIFAQFFPLGDSSQYAHFVFNTFDSGNTGEISFEDFVKGLSILCRGTFLDRIHWTFSLYDVNQDGVISRDEMMQIISAIYDMMGGCCSPPVEGSTPEQHVDTVFDRLDLNRDGFISLDEFVLCCQQDESIAKSMAVFDTML